MTNQKKGVMRKVRAALKIALHKIQSQKGNLKNEKRNAKI